MVNEQIIALGGGGFSMEENSLLDDYILCTCGKDSPRICFVPTSCRATDLRLVRRQIADLEDYACSQDIIYVGGGNTANMLAVWRIHGFDKALRAALCSGTILTGVSSGSICWFQQGVTDSFGAEVQPMDCLGILSGSNCPHYDGEAERRPSYHQFIKQGMRGGFAADDGVGLHFVNDSLRHVVSSRTEAKGYRVDWQGDSVVESAIETRYLGHTAGQQGSSADTASRRH